MRRWRVELAAFVIAAMAFAAPARGEPPSARECIDADEASIKLRESKHLRSARERALVCAVDACPPDIRTECSRAVTGLSEAIPTLVISALDPAGNDLISVRVTVDGNPLLERLDGTAIALDPGPHTFRFEAPAMLPLEKTLLLREGEHDRREIVRFSATPPVLRVRDPGRRAAGLVVGAVGIAGVALGTVAAIVAATFSNDSKNEVSNYPQAKSDYDAARVWAHVSEVGFGTGVVGLVVGSAIFFTAPFVVPGKTTGFGIAFGGRM